MWYFIAIIGAACFGALIMAIAMMSKDEFGPCVCGCGRMVKKGSWDGYHGA